jgi:hypothetical protein
MPEGSTKYAAARRVGGGFFPFLRGDLHEAGERLCESLVVAETSGDVLSRACAFYSLGAVALSRGDKESWRGIAPEVRSASLEIDLQPIASAARGAFRRRDCAYRGGCRPRG